MQAAQKLDVLQQPGADRFAAVQAAQKWRPDCICTLPAFAAVQAAQKTLRAGITQFTGFAAVQAAQKSPRLWGCVMNPFAAVQAAQKRSSREKEPHVRFAAVQAAQKILMDAWHPCLGVCCRSGSPESSKKLKVMRDIEFIAGSVSYFIPE